VTATLVIAAAALAALALLLLALLVRRVQQDVDDLRAATRITALDSRLGALRTDVTAGRAGRTGTSRPADELDELVAGTLEEARELSRADAALLAFTAEDGAAVVVTLGLDRVEAERLARSLPPVTPAARSVSLSYPFPAVPQSDREPVRRGIAVLVPGDDRPLALLTVLARGDGPTFGESEIAALERVAARSRARLARALRPRDSEAAGGPGTALLHAEAFPHILERSVAEAHLRGRALTLVLLELDPAGRERALQVPKLGPRGGRGARRRRRRAAAPGARRKRRRVTAARDDARRDPPRIDRR
jgi:hypothetical protein